MIYQEIPLPFGNFKNFSTEKMKAMITKTPYGKLYELVVKALIKKNIIINKKE